MKVQRKEQTGSSSGNPKGTRTQSGKQTDRATATVKYGWCSVRSCQWYVLGSVSVICCNHECVGVVLGLVGVMFLGRVSVICCNHECL